MLPVDFSDSQIARIGEFLAGIHLSTGTPVPDLIKSLRISYSGFGTIENDSSMAFIVTCHENYLKYLPKLIDSLDRQSAMPQEKIFVFDNCEAPRFMKRRKDFKIIEGKWQNPNIARNIGTAQASSEWICIYDADNWLHPHYFKGAKQKISSSGTNIGIIYADIELDDTKGNILVHRTPEKFDYWQLRLGNYLSGSSLMRRTAVLEAGGWQDTKCYDDWTLVLNMTALGWKAVKQKYPIIARNGQDPHRRDINRQCLNLKFRQQTYAICTLLAGREQYLEEWIRSLQTMELPAKTSLYILDNSQNPDFSRKTRSMIPDERFTHVHYQCDSSVGDTSHPCWRAIHTARLYNRILPKIDEDWLITYEDDMVPPADALTRLITSMPPKDKIGVISAAYLSRRGKGRICASFGLDFDRGRLFQKDVQPKLMKVGCCGGGFALWRNALVKRSLPFRFGYINNVPTGWDSYLCRDIQSEGYAVLMDGSLNIRHKAVEV